MCGKVWERRYGRHDECLGIKKYIYIHSQPWLHTHSHILFTGINKYKILAHEYKCEVCLRLTVLSIKAQTHISLLRLVHVCRLQHYANEQQCVQMKCRCIHLMLVRVAAELQTNLIPENHSPAVGELLQTQTKGMQKACCFQATAHTSTQHRHTHTTHTHYETVGEQSRDHWRRLKLFWVLLIFLRAYYLSPCLYAHSRQGSRRYHG